MVHKLQHYQIELHRLKSSPSREYILNLLLESTLSGFGPSYYYSYLSCDTKRNGPLTLSKNSNQSDILYTQSVNEHLLSTESQLSVAGTNILSFTAAIPAATAIQTSTGEKVHFRIDVQRFR